MSNICRQDRVESRMGLNSDGRLPALPTNITLGRKWLTTANTLTYYGTGIITAVKKFIVQDS